MKRKEINQQNQLQLQILLKQIQEQNQFIANSYPCPELRREWIPRDEVMKFLGYKPTQFIKIVKDYNLRISQIGKHKFFSTQSLQKALNQSQLDK